METDFFKLKPTSFTPPTQPELNLNLISILGKLQTKFKNKNSASRFLC